jgi:2-polyprenyl-3-methyl-5-hydroxy-6-metoxy-1,4-benzoquinol methylase
MKKLIRRVSSSLRFRLGLRVAAPELEYGGDDEVARFYNRRVTDCAFLGDSEHYEHPRAKWLVEQVQGGSLLEIGCGNGGMTRLLAPRVSQLLAIDVSAPSLREVEGWGMENVTTVRALVEDFRPSQRFDWIVMSEVLEHLRRPAQVLAQCLGWLTSGGSLILTTPNGHWESDEHLHEFDLESFSRLLAPLGAESFQAGYVRDGESRRRWLVARILAPESPPATDDFHHRWSVMREQRRKT